MPAVLQSILGIFALLAVAFALSEKRRAIAWKTVFIAIVLQFVIALTLLKIPFARKMFMVLNALVYMLEQATQAGTSFVFGYLGGASPPFASALESASDYILAFRGLPLILVASALSSLLFYWRVLPVIVNAFARLLQRSLGIGGAEGLAAAANIFLGMVEAPLFIRPYLSRLSRGELFSMMTCGMATIAGTVMVIYASILKAVIPDALGHLLIASIISAPASIAVARIMIPTPPELRTDAVAQAPSAASSSMEAIINGTTDGIKLLINIVAMLIVLVALVALVNMLLGLLPAVSDQPLTLQRMLGWFMAPLVWLIGIPWNECMTAGRLMGIKTILNEFISYVELGQLADDSLSERSRMIITYAMCGFANLGSLGIMIGGLGAMAPDRQSEVVALGFKSIIAGTLATLMTGAVIGCLWG